MKREAVAIAGDGTRLRYVIWGQADADRRVALLHSLAMTAEFWEGAARALGEGWEVLALDCRGHGASDKPPGPYSVELFADDLASVFDHAGWDKALVGGASMGGCVSLAFAARHTARTTGLALIDTTAWYGDDAIQNWEERGQKAMTEGMVALTGFQKTRWFSDAFREANPDAVNAAIATFVANDPAAYLETCRMLGRCDQRSSLARFSFPVEILVGEEDYATPVAMSEAMASDIPDATMRVLEGARHFTPLEAPASIADGLTRLVAR